MTDALTAGESGGPTMKIALVHDHYDEAKLTEVIAQMRMLGAPTIRAVWMECYGAWAALEGCHRIRAAQALGITPVIEPADYSDDMITISQDPTDDQISISQVCDSCHAATIIEFAEVAR
jgi:hypothetical protein